MKHTDTPPDLQRLLDALDPQADMVHRHLWLYDLLAWIRGEGRDVQTAVGHVRQIVAAAQRQPDSLPRWRARWLRFSSEVDVTPLLADFGFAPRTAFLSELRHRISRKFMPVTPETTDLSELFELLLPYGFDAQWLRALDPGLLDQFDTLLFSLPADPPAGDAPVQAVPPASAAPSSRPYGVLSYWQGKLLEAITYAVSQITAIGFANDIRVRMTHDGQTLEAFHRLPEVRARFSRTIRLHGREPRLTQDAAQALRQQLLACRAAMSTVYGHLDKHGVSVGIVFMLRQFRDRVQRVHDLLDCLLSEEPDHANVRLLAKLVVIGRERRSVRKLWHHNAHLVASKIAERHAESGEVYITRNTHDWRVLFGHALGGGFAMGFAVWTKFVLTALALSIFWSGLAAGLNYAVVFVLIQLLHWTVATKQPAVTAPAMAARLKDMGRPNAVDGFVDEVAHLIRSQVAAVIGNLVAVMPTVLLLSAALRHGLGHSMIAPAYAEKTLHSLSVLGPTTLFAAATGVMLFASSIIAGWAENWFVFHRLDSSIAYHPRSIARLGPARALRWAAWWRRNISGLAANISLGLLLGLVPAVALFFGLELEVRHVTIAAGQLAAAIESLGLQVVHRTDFWLAVAGVALVGPINVGVSFYLAFRTALTAHDVPRLDRRRIRSALFYRMRQAPLTFMFPPRTRRSAPPPEDAA